MIFRLDEETKPTKYSLWDLAMAVNLEPWELDACARLAIGESVESEADGLIVREEDEKVEVELPVIEVDLDNEEEDENEDENDEEGEEAEKDKDIENG